MKVTKDETGYTVTMKGNELADLLEDYYEREDDENLLLLVKGNVEVIVQLLRSKSLEADLEDLNT